jgi:anti-anti-sigma factor
MMPKGYLTDKGAHRLEQAIEQFLDKGLKKLIINFSDIQFINTSGVSIFRGILQKASEYGCRVCFTNMNELHREVFELTGLLKYVTEFQDEEDAMQYLKVKI